jgi:glyoxylase-like metal-dependent hydrolase (beta-lactamase superfamily II)
MKGVEIADGLWQLRVPLRFNPLGYTYSYLFSDDATLIDAGEDSAEARRSIDEQFQGAGLRLRDTRRIIITHMHRDHVGLVRHIKILSNAEICAHEKAAIYAKTSADGNKRYEAFRNEVRMMGGGEFLGLLGRFEASFRGVPETFEIDKSLENGSEVALKNGSLRVIWMPGHAPEHICLYDEGRRLLFSGDHLLPEITSHISLYANDDGDPLGDYLKSLEKLRGLQVEKILPGHEHVFDSIDERIDELERHHDMRIGEIKEALSDGENTVFKISSKISWKSRPWPLMPFWVKRMAASETLAHLVYLRNKGDVDEKIVDGVLYYSLSHG